MFGDDRVTVTAVQVAGHLEVARSTAYRYVQRLLPAHFLEESAGGGFRLGRRVLEPARLARRRLGLSEIARPVMQQLAEDVGEAVLLTRPAEPRVSDDRLPALTGAVRAVADEISESEISESWRLRD